MQLTIITLFPRMFAEPFAASIVGRAQRSGAVAVRIVNLRDYATDRHRSVDDAPFGGGPGMVLKTDVLASAIRECRGDDGHVVLLSPQGRVFEQSLARDLASEANLVLVCGHYEGVDERVRQTLVDTEVSIGDYVLTNGNLAAMVVADAVIRLLPGALGSAESAGNDSFGPARQLDHPQFTKPAVFGHMQVPPVLLSGNHGNIARWRREQARIRTTARRPDLLMPADGDRP